MFRRLPSSLPKDPKIPSDLEQLGFFINDSDQIRMVRKPEQKYQYKINRNDRINDLHKEAINSNIRRIVHERLLKLGLQTCRLPLGSDIDGKHIPIYISTGINRKSRILVIFGERNQDLGILSHRAIGELGIKVGSVQELVTAVLNDPTTTLEADVPGIIITNPGQLIWYHAGGRAIGYSEYLNIERLSAVHGPFRVDPKKNRVPGNTSHTEHVQYIFEHVMTNVAPQEARFDVIGLEYTGDAVVRYLTEHWVGWRDRINGICLGNPQFKLEELESSADGAIAFRDFLAKRVRAYFVSDKPLETPVPGRNEHGCNCYSSGEVLYEDGILVKGWRSMLDWFNMISVLGEYEEPVLTEAEAE